MKQEFVSEIRSYTATAAGIAFDTCHKIYILMDEGQMRQMREYGYDPLISAKDVSAADMTDTVIEWYEDSCGLRFVSAVETNPNGTDEFITIIGQFDEADDPEPCRVCGDSEQYEDDMCYYCWESENEDNE